MQCPACGTPLEKELHEDVGPKDRNVLYWCEECDYQGIWRQHAPPRDRWQVVFPGIGVLSPVEILAVVAV